MVHDLVFEKGAGDWSLAKSAYPKLKLPEGEIRRVLGEAGLAVGETSAVRGMTVLVAAKPAG
jgi:hypothetical protein